MKTLTWTDLRKLGHNGKGNKWFPNSDIADYFSSIRAPSHAWPHSYAKAAQTAKFARWLLSSHPDVAASVGLSDGVGDVVS